MVVTQLLGGLGNQLFQYAVGRALASKHGTVLGLDASRLRESRLRRYVLRHFNIRAQELSEDELRALGLNRAANGRFSRVMRRLFCRPRLRTVREESFHFDPEVLDAPPHCYLEGYWQSPKYFAAIEAELRNDLEVRDPILGLNGELALRIAESTSVSLHVRRGDYASNPITREFHGLCDTDYYRRAQERLVDLVGPVTFYVFSDDPGWVRENLRFVGKAEIVDHNGPDRDYEDLRLMTLCRHHIIANSTFSWWGAWLSPYADKKVVAPRNWFKGAPQSADDLLPSDWLRV